MKDWGDATLADICEYFALAIPDQVAVVHGDRRLTWREFNRRADGVAGALLAAGLERQDRVALYLYNSPEYLEAYLAASKASLVPANTNYRYGDDELTYLWNDADAAAVVFHGEFADAVERVRSRVATVRLWLWVDDDTGPCPSWAVPYASAVAALPSAPPWSRSGGDLVFVYTGGTTGLPKGVMLRQSNFILTAAVGGSRPSIGLEEYLRGRTTHGARHVVLPAPPLMHGTGVAGAIHGLVSGGTVVLLANRRFDALQLWDVVERERVRVLTVVGDAFARPMLDALDAEPGRWKLECLRSIVSAGAMFSGPTKKGLLAHLPGLNLVDQLGSSENAGAATNISRSGKISDTGAFRPQPGVRVIDDDGHDIEPGLGQVGVIAIPGGAEGYHKDPVKTAATFRLIDGIRYTVAGDHATIEADGSIRFVGRGSGCINTGGEKVFPEEVEEALKSHASVRDAIVVGVPDDRFGETIAAVVELEDASVRDDELVDHVRAGLARFKAPRYIVRVDSVGRTPSGKVDYPATRALILKRLAAATEPA
jgi:acyl-CoA synthetase (AMP-forming)/AMP-acid ligase II